MVEQASISCLTLCSWLVKHLPLEKKFLRIRSAENVLTNRPYPELHKFDAKPIV